MFGLTRLTLLALALSSTALAGSHSRHKRRHHHADRHVEERSGGNSTQTLSKRAFTGRGTFYDVGLGACGQYSSPGDYMVALNSAQYGGGYPGPQCFKKITIQCNGVTVGGVTIMDECPTCDWGGLDLSRGLFTRFADESVGVIQLTWWFEGEDSPAPATTTSQWVEPSPAWTPPPSSEAPPPTSTWTPPPPTSTSTWVAPTSTSTWVAPSSSAAPSSSSTTSTWTWSSASLAPSSSAAASNSTNPFAIIATDNSTATSTSLSASASASASSSAGSTPEVVQSSTQGNLVAINGLVAAYGQLIVTGAGGYE